MLSGVRYTLSGMLKKYTGVCIRVPRLKSATLLKMPTFEGFLGAGFGMISTHFYCTKVLTGRAGDLSIRKLGGTPGLVPPRAMTLFLARRGYPCTETHF